MTVEIFINGVLKLLLEMGIHLEKVSKTKHNTDLPLAVALKL